MEKYFESLDTVAISIVGFYLKILFNNNRIFHVFFDYLKLWCIYLKSEKLCLYRFSILNILKLQKLCSYRSSILNILKF